MHNMSENGSTDTLISPEYRAQQQQLHETTAYGTASILYAPIISQIIQKMEVTHLLDYGCGSETNLAKHLKVPHKVTYQAYDPAVPRFSKPPLPAQLVACIDVLEHIEPDYLKSVLNDLCRVTEAILFASIDTGPALKVLPDGRNAHLIQRPMSWWLPKLWQRWELQTVQASSEHSFFVVAFAKAHLENMEGCPLV